MEAAKNAAACAGWSMNPSAPIDQRLACSKQALDFYIDRVDKIHKLIDDLRADAKANQSVNLDASVLAAAAAMRLEKILDGTVPMDEVPK